MSLNLPERASYEYVKKLAKERLAFLRAKNPGTKLADARLVIAREYGFSSWRALKAEMDLRRAPNVAEFMRTCAAGHVGEPTRVKQRSRPPSEARRLGLTDASPFPRVRSVHPARRHAQTRAAG